MDATIPATHHDEDILQLTDPDFLDFVDFLDFLIRSCKPRANYVLVLHCSRLVCCFPHDWLFCGSDRKAIGNHLQPAVLTILIQHNTTRLSTSKHVTQQNGSSQSASWRSSASFDPAPSSKLKNLKTHRGCEQFIWNHIGILTTSAVMHVSHFSAYRLPQWRRCAWQKKLSCPRRRPHCLQPGCHAPRRETWTWHDVTPKGDWTLRRQNPFGASNHLH